jgi:fatty acid synthase subunit beta, fungi type
MDMVVESSGVTQRFFKTINETTTSYSFRHKQGLLYSTEFAQPALTIMERAQYMFLKSKGLFSDSALFAGHSLGEYTALSTIGDIMPFEKVLSVVFYRGLTMQAAVERDASGRSKFAMVAVNPSRVSKAFTQEKFQLLVKLIREESKELLEVVNYNVEGQQYVCAGELSALDALADATNYISAHQAEILSAESPRDALASLVTKCVLQARKKPQPIQLTRGLATIPLEGIDVPFHSSFLLPRMPAFRNLLLRHIPLDSINPEKLVGKYVSNVTGKPFGISKEHFEDVYAKTGSTVLAECIREMTSAA